MKREDLFEAIGGTEDELLEENVAPAEKKSNIPALIGIAACVALAVFGVTSLPKGKPLQPGEEIVEVPMTETVYYNAAPGETEAATEAPTELSTESTEPVKIGIVSQTVFPGNSIWYAKALGSDAESFYTFREDGSGCIQDAKTGEATDFTYTVTGFASGVYGYRFEMEIDGETREAGIGGSWTDDYCYLSWDPDGRSEKMLYISEDVENFRFYTDAELCEIVGKAHGLNGSPYELPAYYLVPSEQFPKVIVSLTVGEWQKSYYYTVDRLTGEILKKPAL